jgi:endonuclease/exonuclease/phosphatase family metal-dependent hydrolase
MNRWILIGVVLLCGLTAWSQDTAKLMFYNLLNFPEAPPGNRAIILRDIINDVAPDVLMVAELQDQAGADIILNQSLNDNRDIYASAPFALNTSGSGGSIQQLLYYNTEKFTLELMDIIQTSLRDINRYQLKAITTQSDANPILIDFFVAHFKASQGDSNVQTRFNMALDFTNYLNANLSSDANIVFAGDFNFYTANESGFQQLFIGNTIIPMNDPINQLGDWHTNSSFSQTHTQSTRESNNSFDDFGAGGGLDDRFDFIFVSGNILDPNHEVSYVAGSYETYGNNGNCYNEDISDTSCSGPYSQTIRNLLWNMSDHLPLVMELKFEQNFLSNDVYVDKDILDFPQGNVVTSNLIVKVNPQYLGKIQKFYVYNTLGHLVKTEPVNTSITSISTYDLASGLYILKSDFGNSFKFLVSN